MDHNYHRLNKSQNSRQFFKDKLTSHNFTLKHYKERKKKNPN